MRLLFVLGEAWTGLRRNLSMTVSVALVTMVSLLFLGLGLLGYRQVTAMKSFWYDNIQVSVVLCNATSAEPSCAKGPATDGDRQAIEKQLAAMPVVESVHFESQQEAYQRFQQQFKDTPWAQGARPEHLPASYRVRLSDPQQYRQITSTLQGAPGVAKIEDQRKVVDPLVDLVSTLTVVAVSLASVMLVCAVLLVATTVRQSAFSRRRETGIMRLVGAGSGTIRAPFVLETVVASLVGAGLASGLLWGLLAWGTARQGAQRLVLGGVSMIGVDDLWPIVPVLVAVALLVAILTSWFALRRHLRV